MPGFLQCPDEYTHVAPGGVYNSIFVICIGVEKKAIGLYRLMKVFEMKIFNHTHYFKCIRYPLIITANIFPNRIAGRGKAKAPGSNFIEDNMLVHIRTFKSRGKQTAGNRFDIQRL